MISPQPWDGFQVSKHHYAKELTRLGNTVFFVDPPVLDGTLKPGQVHVSEDERDNRIQLVKYCPRWYNSKFHARWLFDRTMRYQARHIVNRCGGRFNCVWDFDNTYNFISLQHFKADLSIFHAVDQISSRHSSPKNADFVFSVAQPILNRIDVGDTPAHVIGHGLAPEYVSFARNMLATNAFRDTESPVRRVGYVGNLLAQAIDQEVITSIIKQHPDIVFDFIGPYTTPSVPNAPSWVAELMKLSNCVFHGLKTQNQILDLSVDIDLWLICYDNEKDINGGANSHKAMEYLATGKPVVSSHLLAYEGTELLHMPISFNNDTLPPLFSRIASEPRLAKSSEQRVRFALRNSYTSRLNEIAELIGNRNLSK